MNKQQNFHGLIPLSGGIDSSALLYHTLKENPDKAFLVFKIDLISSTSASRTIKEKNAVRNICEWLRHQNLHNFKFIEMRFDYSAFSPPPVWDSEVVNYAAALCLLAHPEIKVFYDGAIKNDFEDPDFQNRLNKIEHILFTVSNRNKTNLQQSFPLAALSKYEVMKLMPMELLNLTWSCRYPEGGPEWTLKRCHKCPPCLIIDEVLKKHPGEFNPDW